MPPGEASWGATEEAVARNWSRVLSPASTSHGMSGTRETERNVEWGTSRPLNSFRFMNLSEIISNMTLLRKVLVAVICQNIGFAKRLSVDETVRSITYPPF